MSAATILDPMAASAVRDVNHLHAAYRQRGWTIWHGNATGQYWAAHTGSMMLLSGNSAQQLAVEIEKVQPSKPVTQAPPPRRYSPWRLPPRPRPRGSW